MQVNGVRLAARRLDWISALILMAISADLEPVANVSKYRRLAYPSAGPARWTGPTTRGWEGKCGKRGS
jgi:hypothetical protein